jgi:YD repeat-containing protein
MRSQRGRARCVARTTNYVSSTLLGVTDQRGNLTTVTFDSDGNGNITSVTNPLGETVSYTFDAYDYNTAIIDPNGNITTMTYASGLPNATSPVESITYADGGTYTYVYDMTNSWMTAAIDPLGRITTLSWDSGTGQRTAVVDPLGEITSFAYNSRGQMWAITNPRGYTTSYVYDDGTGNLAAMVSPLGEITSYQYNAYNQPPSKTRWATSGPPATT